MLFEVEVVAMAPWFRKIAALFQDRPAPVSTPARPALGHEPRKPRPEAADESGPASNIDTSGTVLPRQSRIRPSSSLPPAPAVPPAIAALSSLTAEASPLKSAVPLALAAVPPATTATAPLASPGAPLAKTSSATSAAVLPITPLTLRPATPLGSAAAKKLHRPLLSKAAAPTTASAASPLHAPPDLHAPLFDWFVGVPPPSAAAHAFAPPSAGESRMLSQLGALIAQESARAELLPRAPAVIPQLLNGLRHSTYNAALLAEHVSRDVSLLAEVMRMANSASHRRGDALTDVEQAVSRLGAQGLRQAIARVVLKPMYDAPAGSYSGRSAQRLWEHSEAKAKLCTALATQAGIDPFEGYLAGLVHDVGWAAAFRMLDRADPPLATPFSRAFAGSLAREADRLFGKIAQAWDLHDSVTALARAMSSSPLAAVRLPLGHVLCEGDRLASLHVLCRAGVVNRSEQHWLLALPDAVVEAFDALAPRELVEDAKAA
ncbi:MAG: hypothetical protein JWP52_2530 [Rhizobacter sp.]|nr:hypothetical protein [Rhizobacter sp.]